MLTAVVVYIYSVVAFNFFRKFYAQEGEEGEDPKYKCNDLATVSSKADQMLLIISPFDKYCTVYK